MPTLFKLVEASGNSPDIDVARFQQALPTDMKLDSCADGMYVSVDSDDETAQFRIDRELDRLYFLTCVRIRAEMCRTTVTATLTIRYSIHGSLPPTIMPMA